MRPQKPLLLRARSPHQLPSGLHSRSHRPRTFPHSSCKEEHIHTHVWQGPGETRSLLTLPHGKPITRVRRHWPLATTSQTHIFSLLPVWCHWTDSSPQGECRLLAVLLAFFLASSLSWAFGCMSFWATTSLVGWRRGFLALSPTSYPAATFQKRRKERTTGLLQVLQTANQEGFLVR